MSSKFQKNLTLFVMKTSKIVGDSSAVLFLSHKRNLCVIIQSEDYEKIGGAVVVRVFFNTGRLCKRRRCL